ncbi:MAG TPA: PAS domain S-box protein [Terriglobales bacterium]
MKTRSFTSPVWLGIGELLPWVRQLCPALLLLIIIRPAFAIAAEEKNVLILDTYSAGDQSTALLESDLRRGSSWHINFYVENIEVWRFDDQGYERALFESLERVYRGRKLDVVMTRAYPALQFAVKFRDQLFPGVPIVFYQVAAERMMGRKWPGVTGEMWGANFLGGTIDLALRLHPDTDTIAVIANDSKFDQYWVGRLHAELGSRPKLSVIDLVGLPPSELLTKVAALPPRTVILFQETPQRSGDQRAAGYYEALSLAEHHRPTYCSFARFCVGHGGIGGIGTDVPKQMLRIAGLARRVLSGERPDDIPIVNDTEQLAEFDLNELRYWKIKESALPAGSVILNREPTPFQRYRSYIIDAVAIFVLQAFLIVGLLWQRSRKRKAEAVLRESEKRFRVMADTTPSLIWMCDEKGQITYLNDRRLAFTSADHSEVGYGDAWTAYVYPDDLPHVMDSLSWALKSQQSFSKEYRLRRHDGEYRWMFDVASPRVNGDGSFAGFIGSAIDVTDQKLAHEALEKVGGRLIEAQEEERRRIARELHDDISQKLILLSMEIAQANANGSADEIRDRLEVVRQHCSDVADDVQSLSHQLHSARLDYLGVSAAIRGYCIELGKQYSIDIRCMTEEIPAGLPRNVSLCLFRVAQEALHNATKYSGTRELAVNLRATGNYVLLAISDTGVGFDLDDPENKNGLGLVSMRERVHLIGGHFHIESALGKGTQVKVSVPVNIPRCVSDGDSSGQTNAVAGAA